MKILHAIEELSSVPGPVHLAIGVFDGIHPGHREVIQQAVNGARGTGGSAVVVTFDPHPIRVLRPEKAPSLLVPPQNKQRLVERLGADAMLIVTFTAEFARTPPEAFIRRLHAAANGLHAICVGQGWSFGANRSGGTSLLESLAHEFGFKLTAVAPVLVSGRRVSSTLIRAAAERGDIDEASRLLGRQFAFWGTALAAAWAKELAEMDRHLQDDLELCGIEDC
jgi:riboflavin kinase/FMN adenylyltransferase